MHRSLLILAICATPIPLLAEPIVELSVSNGGVPYAKQVLAERVACEPGQAFVIAIQLDPIVQSTGNAQAGAGIAIGLASPEASPHPRDYPKGSPYIGVVFKEMADRGEWHLIIDGQDVSIDPPDRGTMRDGDLQRPHVFASHAGDYRLFLVGTPHPDGTRLRLYLEHLDRPIEDHVVPRVLVPSHVGFFIDLDSKATEPATFRVNSVRTEVGSSSEVDIEQSARDAVLTAIDWSHPAIVELKPVYESGRYGAAAAGLLEHLRKRTDPPGAPLLELYYGSNFLEVANHAIEGRYGTAGYGAKFSDKFAGPNGLPRWELDSGYLNRHFHWCSLAKAYQHTSDEKYAQRFAAEVSSWVRNEPFLVADTPYIPGVDWMDGTRFHIGYMNTSNIGRRCEMTWWPAYEAFRRSPSFNDEAHFDMLLGFLRQARLLTNPSSFAWWDDGGAHGTLALLQTALMLPEFKEASTWKRVAEDRLRQVIAKQFYADGSHVSLSSGYNFATIHALENVARLYRRFGIDAELIKEPLESAYRHPMALARPVQRGQVDLNDGGWGPIDDHLAFGHEMLPGDELLQWFATSGQDGSPDALGSVYFPNAGHFVMRTGWGKNDRFLFMDAGPVGASHGKEDKLSITLDVGGNVLLGNGGRAGYNEPDLGRYTGMIYSQNALVVDRLDQTRITRRREIYGWTPEKRRWFSSPQFDFAEGFHTDGWYSSSTSVQGRQIRQIVAVRGGSPPESTYFIIVDRVDFDDDQSHSCEVLWHSHRNQMGVTPTTHQVDAWDGLGAVRILPVITEGLESESIIGQTSPRMIGWQVYGSAKKGSATCIHRWEARGRTTRAWVVIPSSPGEEPTVRSVELASHDTDQFSAYIERLDGATDRLTCFVNTIGEAPDLRVECLDQNDRSVATFDSRSLTTAD